ncbi:MAG: SRPBCC domain-containing protein [Candidatus Methanofastidiosum sp.]|nr:SRPBCC domain-containing protein [Methanofastidiosum sp.]
MIVLKDTIQINAPPEKVFEFFLNMDKERYILWHPQDHVEFHFEKGNRIEEGAIAYFEEYIHGELHKMKIVYKNIIQNRQIEFMLTNLFWRIFLTKSKFLIELKNGGCEFKAYNYYKLGPISSRSERSKINCSS